VHDVKPIPARSIQFDSRKVQGGDVFVAISGTISDGHDYLDEAVANGAIALIIGQGRHRPDIKIPQYEVINPRVSLAKISAAFENHPGNSLCLIGVTGTNGKSTTSFILNSILEKAGLVTGMMTTIETRIGNEILSNSTRLTSQESPEIQNKLALMAARGCSHIIIEATSIGLHMRRLDGCEFDLAIFTNLTPDHLDYHGDIASYVNAKALLFAKLKRHGDAIINGSDEYSSVFQTTAEAQEAIVSLYNLANVTNIKMSNSGTVFQYTFLGENKPTEIQSRLIGNYNLENILAAIRAAEALGINSEFIRKGIWELPQIPGRMEIVSREPFTVIVDYAHTENGVSEVLSALDLVNSKARKIVVIGCAGERDKDRRAGIGHAVAEAANFVLLTDEDPRSEDSLEILNEISHSIMRAGKLEGDFFEKIPDRRSAIRRAFEVAREGDIVLIAGKGHESSIEYKNATIPWSDVDVAVEILNEFKI
jgi:UDP-N-acetylmuramoyl-L-alanyl-D-glutamate--2,6-diaminopimelate ligase